MRRRRRSRLAERRRGEAFSRRKAWHDAVMSKRSARTRDTKGRPLGKRSGPGRTPNRLRGVARTAKVVELRGDLLRYVGGYRARGVFEDSLDRARQALSEALSAQALEADHAIRLMRAIEAVRTDALPSLPANAPIGSKGWLDGAWGRSTTKPEQWRWMITDATGKVLERKHPAPMAEAERLLRLGKQVRVVWAADLPRLKPDDPLLEVWVAACKMGGVAESVALDVAGAREAVKKRDQRRGNTIKRATARIHAAHVAPERERLQRARNDLQFLRAFATQRGIVGGCAAVDVPEFSELIERDIGWARRQLAAADPLLEKTWREYVGMLQQRRRVVLESAALSQRLSRTGS